VIPQEARQDFNLKPGDKVMILSPTGTGILIVPVEKVKQRLQIFKDFLDNDLD
jgi:AbrB family looped-hinge helix DNA binding protein